MFAFAERAAEQAPPGSKLHALPLLAAVEYRSSPTTPPQGPDPYRARVEAAVTRALALSDSYAPGDREAAGFRNHLALMLSVAEPLRARPSRSSAPSACTPPRTRGPYFGDAREEFLEARSGIRIELAIARPLSSAARRSTPRPPRPRLGRRWRPASLAIAAPRPTEVAQAALICGISPAYRPRPGSGHSYVELVPDPSPGKRAALLPRGPADRRGRQLHHR